MNRNTTYTAPIDEFITVADVQRYLKISQSAAYSLTHAKDFPVFRLGNSIRIPKAAFFAWVALKTSIPTCVADQMRTSA